jgi:hypothetical protein
MKKATPIFVISFLVLSVGLFSGCEKKEVVEPVDERNNHQEDNTENDLGEKKEFSSELIKLSFLYDSENEYKERLVHKEDDIHNGDVVAFESKNENQPSFDVITKDFVLKKGINFRDPIEFNESNEPIHFRGSVKEFEKIKKLDDNTYQFIGFSNYECSLSVSSNLVYIFPKESTLKYAVFYLGNAEVFEESDLKDICDPKEDEIVSRLNNIEKGEISNILIKQKGGLEIIESFSF